VLAAFETAPRDAEILLGGPEGTLRPERTRRGGGPPFWLCAEFPRLPSGRYAVAVRDAGRTVGRGAVDVPLPGSAWRAAAGVWESAAGWTRDSENLYSAWLDALFEDADERTSWNALHEVVRDAARNIFFDSLGLGEDDGAGPNAIEMTPDCADNPFFLRAYFAWKAGLPFGFHSCTWGTLEAAPHVLKLWTNDAMNLGGANTAQAFARLMPILKDTVHAGNGRTKFADDTSDYYPLPLTRRDLRPGSVFADPYGHTLTIVRWVPQSGKRPGLLLAVDAQPDGTIGIKRFWRGNFLFNTQEVVGEPGFKAFRPIVLDGGRPRLLANREIAASPDYGNFSLEQEHMASDAFYAVMEKLINPEPLDAESAFHDLFRAFHEQLLVRVESVAKGEEYMKSRPGVVIPMPAGGEAVFQTTGPWEDYSTPNRDLRLLIAMDTILGFPEKVAANPEAFGIPARRPADAVVREMAALEKKWAAEMSITYTRSDGSLQVLTLTDVLGREGAFEMGYNPNDGPEIRWGAPEGSAEMATCRRRAPAYQLTRMRAMRVWFKRRLHPAA